MGRPLIAVGKALPPMRSMLLSDLRLALPDLVDNKVNLLKKTHAGRLYHPLLVEQRESIFALPEPTGYEGRPLAEELGRVDGEHDGFGGAIWHYTEAVRLAPGVADDVKKAALAVRETFIPELAILRGSYATEAAHAVGKRARLAEHTSAFARLPVPGKKTLGAWVEGFVTQGETLDKLLKARGMHNASTVTERTRSDAGKLRAETLALLYRLRATLADELRRDPEALAKHDAELFSYFDQLAADRDASYQRRGPTTSEGAAEPTVPTASLAPAAVA
jgi:hypothetical protein